MVRKPVEKALDTLAQALRHISPRGAIDRSLL
jgi:hypothetical protein